MTRNVFSLEQRCSWLILQWIRTIFSSDVRMLPLELSHLAPLLHDQQTTQHKFERNIHYHMESLHLNCLECARDGL
jgi:hypothetical protein